MNQDFVEQFRVLAAARLESIEDGLSGFDRGVPVDLDAALRELHTLKGEAGLLGFPKLKKLAHALETGVASDVTALPSADATARIRDVRHALKVARELLAGTEREGLDDLLDRLAAAQSDLGPTPLPTDTLTTTEQTEGQAPVGPTETEAQPRMSAPSSAGPSTGPVVQVRAAALRDVAQSAERVLSDAIAVGAAVESLRAALEADGAATRSVWGSVAGLDRSLQQLRQHAEATASRVREVRFVPVRPSLRRHATRLTALAEASEKDVDVDIDERGVFVERAVMDVLDGALVHVVTNVVDHGLETPDARRARGVAPCARVRIVVDQRAGEVRLAIHDDGPGLNADGLWNNAVARGVVPAEDRPSYDDAALHELVFSPGLSSRSDVDETSGRGVGMAAVREAVERIGGTVVLRRKEAGGTECVFRVPTRQGLLPVCVVEAGPTHVAFPARAVLRVLLSPVEQALEPSVWLSAIGFADAVPAGEGEGATRWVELEAPESGRLYIEATRVRWAMGTIVPFGYRGFAPRVEGLVSLDTAEQIVAVDSDALCGALLAHVQHPKEELAQDDAPVALVVDDSDILRGIIREGAELAGFRVLEAASGWQALDVLDEHRPAVITTDLEMPGMDGWSLLENLRFHHSGSQAEIVVISTLVGEDLRAKIDAAGATSMLTKEDLDAQAVASTLLAVGQAKSGAHAP